MHEGSQSLDALGLFLRNLLTPPWAKDMADGPQKRPAYTPEDYKRLLNMHRCGESAERIALVLGRSTSSVFNHFRKRKPIWLEAGVWRERHFRSCGVYSRSGTIAGEQVEPEWLLRDNDIDYNKRIQRECASPAANTVANIITARLAVNKQPAPSIPSGSPSTSATSLPTGTAQLSQISRPPPAKPVVPHFTFGKDALASSHSSATAKTSKTSRPPPAKSLNPPFAFPPPAEPLNFTFGNNARAPVHSSATAQTPQTSRPPPAKPLNPPLRFGNDAPAPPRLSATALAPTATAAPPKVNLFAKLGPPSSTSVVGSPMTLPAAARTVSASAPTIAPSSTGFSAYSTASISSFSPTPSLVTRPVSTSAPSSGTKPVPTSVPLPTAVAPPPPVELALQVVKSAANAAPPPLPIPAPTSPAKSLDPDAPPLSPSSDDSPPSFSQRLPNPVPHHAPHLPLLPLWCDGHYEQAMSGLKRFLQLVEGSRKSRTRATSSS